MSQVGETQPPLTPTTSSVPRDSTACATASTVLAHHLLCALTGTSHGAEVVRSPSRLFVSSPSNSSAPANRSDIGWLRRCLSTSCHDLRSPSSTPRGSPPRKRSPPMARTVLVISTSPSHPVPTLLPVVAARLLCLRSAPRVAVTLTVTVAGVLTTAISVLPAHLLVSLPLALLAHPAHAVHQVALLRLIPTVRWASAPPTAPVGGASPVNDGSATPTLVHSLLFGSAQLSSSVGS